jgi:hypothetical protein
VYQPVLPAIQTGFLRCGRRDHSHEKYRGDERGLVFELLLGVGEANNAVSLGSFIVAEVALAEAGVLDPAEPCARPRGTSGAVDKLGGVSELERAVVARKGWQIGLGGAQDCQGAKTDCEQ